MKKTKNKISKHLKDSEEFYTKGIYNSAFIKDSPKNKYEFLSKMEVDRRSSGISSIPGNEYDYIHYKNIEFNNGYRLSVQANSAMYCSPRINAEKEKYYEFEIACLDNVGRWLVVKPNLVSEWSFDSEGFCKHKKHNYLFEKEPGKSTAVAGYVDAELVEMVYQYLKKIPIRQILIEKTYYEKRNK